MYLATVARAPKTFHNLIDPYHMVDYSTNRWYVVGRVRGQESDSRKGYRVSPNSLNVIGGMVEVYPDGTAEPRCNIFDKGNAVDTHSMLLIANTVKRSQFLSDAVALEVAHNVPGIKPNGYYTDDVTPDTWHDFRSLYVPPNVSERVYNALAPRLVLYNELTQWLALKLSPNDIDRYDGDNTMEIADSTIDVNMGRLTTPNGIAFVPTPVIERLKEGVTV